jgi:hypothetical protein
MSESTFPFGASAEPESSELPVEESAEGESRKPLLLVGGLVAALTLGAGAFLLLGGGDDTEEALAVPARPDSAAAAAPEAVQVIPAASGEVVGRNPFKALYTAPAAGGSTAGTQDGTPATDATPEEQATVVRLSAPTPVAPTPTTVTIPAAPTPLTPAPGTTAPGAPAPAAPAPAPQPVVPDDGMRFPVTLLSIDAKTPGEGAPAVQFGHAEEDFQVLLGKSFGRFQHLRVVGIVREDARSGVLLQIGDGSPFYVAVNETVYVL